MKRSIVRYTSEITSNLPESFPSALKRIFAHRGIKDQQQLDYSLNKLLPFNNLLNMDKAVAVLTQAIEREEHILVVGDFDADGATSTSLAVSALKIFGAKQVSYLVPNRFEYGYGLTPEIVAVAAKRQPNLIMTVDNGISSVEGVEAAHDFGIPVLITDHHLPGLKTPRAVAIINPNQIGDEFKSKNLAGVGVVFYLMWALRNQLHANRWFIKLGQEAPNIANFLDFVALGTIADLVPLDFNNRILVQQGIKRIRSHPRPGIQALLEVARRKAATLVASDLGFALGPRLNAAGRLDDMSLGIECLLSENLLKAREIAQRLDTLNQERRIIENDMQQQANEILVNLSLQKNYIPTAFQAETRRKPGRGASLPQEYMNTETSFSNLAPAKAGESLSLKGEEYSLPTGLCIYHEEWHQGVIGILASRVKDHLYRPVIAFANSNEPGMLKGSARSVPGLHIRDILDLIANRYPHLMDKFGGHAQAAGLQMSSAVFDEFCHVFNQTVTENLSAENLVDQLMSDGALTEEEITLNLVYLLREVTPWGQHFPPPLFDGRFKVLDQRLVGDKHLKMTLQIENGSKSLSAIAFNVDLNMWPNPEFEDITAAYRLDINEYQGQQNLQLILEYIEVGTLSS